MHASFMGTDAPVPGNLLDLAQCISSSGCSAVSFPCVLLCHKLVNLSVSMSSVAVLANTGNQGRGSCEPLTCNQLGQKLLVT